MVAKFTMGSEAGWRRTARFAAGLGAVLSFGFVSTSAIAGEPRWPAGTYKYITVDQSIRDTLIDYGRNIGLPVRVSEKVKGRVIGPMPRVTAQQFLQDLCTRYGLVWHFDGSVLNVATEEEVQTEMIRVDANTAVSAGGRLEELGVTDVRFPIKISASDDLVSVSGPPSYIALVRKALGTSSQEGETAAQLVRIFRGRSTDAQAFAVDKPQD